MTESAAGGRELLAGPWFGILGERVTLLLPPDQQQRAAALWSVVDSGAGFEEVLEEVLAHGLRSLSGLVLVEEAPDAWRVLVRGACRVTVLAGDGSIEVAGAADAVWVERTVPGATGALLVPGEDAGPEGTTFTLSTGLTRVGRVRLGAAGPAGDPDRPSAAGQDGPDPGSDPAAVPDTRTAAPQPPEPPVPGIPGQPAAPPVTARPVARLVLSTGDVVDVDRAILIGRAPEARRFAPNDQPRLVTVPSPQHEISATHLEIRPGAGADHGMAVVTDMGSTNGTVLVQPGLPPEELRAGVAVALIPGAILDLGDGVTVQTTNP